jgi:hypothetical protein
VSSDLCSIWSSAVPLYSKLFTSCLQHNRDRSYLPREARVEGLPRSPSDFPLTPPNLKTSRARNPNKTSTGQSETDFPLPPPTETPTHVIDSDALRCVDESCRLSYLPLSGSTNFQILPRAPKCVLKDLRHSTRTRIPCKFFLLYPRPRSMLFGIEIDC